MDIKKFRHGAISISMKKGDLISEIPDLTVGTPVGICPECGEELVVRRGKFGNFIGCKGFQHGCRNTYKIDGFKAIKDMEISVRRCKRPGHGFELSKTLFVRG